MSEIEQIPVVDNEPTPAGSMWNNEEEFPQELEDVDVEDEEEASGPSVGSNFHQYTPHRVIRVRDPCVEGAPLIPFNAAGRYHSKTIIGAFRKATNKIFDLNNFDYGKTIWLTMSWKVPYDTDQVDEEGKVIQATKEEHEQYFFTRIPASKPKKLYLYDKDATAIRSEWKSETTIVDEGTSLVKMFRDVDGNMHKFTIQELRQTNDILNPDTNVMERRGPAHHMESVGLLYNRPSANLTIEQLDGVWTRKEGEDTSTIEPKENPKDKDKHHVVDFKCQSVEVMLEDDAIEIQRIEEAEKEYALNPPPKPVKRNRRDDANKLKPRRKRIMTAEEIKEQLKSKKQKEATPNQGQEERTD